MSTHTETNSTYSIKEAAKLSGRPESTLRYYESVGIIRPIGRDESSKHRVYSQEDIDLIDSIACLSATGMSLEDMRRYLSNRTRGAEGAAEEITLLEARRQRLDDEAHFLKLRQAYVATKIAYWQAVAEGNGAEAKTIAERAATMAKDLKFPRRKT